LQGLIRKKEEIGDMAKMRGVPVLLLVFLLGVVMTAAKQDSIAAEKLTFNLGWVPYGRDLSWYNSLEGGFYKAEGLDVKIVRGYGGSKTAKDIASGGGADFGGVDSASVVLGRARGLPLKIVVIEHDIAPFVVRTLEGNGVNSLKDLEGKKFGTPAGDATWSNFPTLAKVAGFDINKIQVINVAPAARETGLLGGQYAACTGFVTQVPIFRRMAAKQGKKEKILLLALNGLNFYGFGYAVNDKTLADRGEAVRKFLRASMKGLAAAIHDPEKAMERFLKHAPTAARGPNREVWDITLDLWLTPDQQRLGLGWMTDEKWRRTRDIIVKANNIKKNIPLGDLYTNEYLPKILPPKRAPRAIGKVF
jgi:NitT/TauT family transport system substrate-binding protein